MLLKGFYKAPPGILEEIFAHNPAFHKAGRGDEFHIHLDMLAGISICS